MVKAEADSIGMWETLGNVVQDKGMSYRKVYIKAP